MIGSIYIAMTGLHGYEQGLRVISNDTANLNTPGFKGSTLQFADLFYAGGNQGGGGGSDAAGQYGYGVAALGTRLVFRQGQLRNSGNDLDAAIDGQGFFVLKDTAGHVHYTRDGEFTVNGDGFLVSATTGEQVMALGGDGALTPIGIAALRTNPAQATAAVTFGGNLSSTATTDTISNVTVIDPSGASHTLSLKLEPVAGSAGTWTATLLDGSTTVGWGQFAFINGRPDPQRSKVSIDYTPTGQPAQTVALDFSTNVTSYDSGSRSTLAITSQDGHGSGELSQTSFDETGTLVLQYSNGQTVKGPKLALARFNSTDDVNSVGRNEFQATAGAVWSTGVAGERGFGNVRSGMVETSNVDLSEEFSDLVIMQRGYQASSQVISTANEMLGELFSMRGSR